MSLEIGLRSILKVHLSALLSEFGGKESDIRTICANSSFVYSGTLSSLFYLWDSFTSGNFHPKKIEKNLKSTKTHRLSKLKPVSRIKCASQNGHQLSKMTGFSRTLCHVDVVGRLKMLILRMMRELLRNPVLLGMVS